jgi:hypothetical protein
MWTMGDYIKNHSANIMIKFNHQNMIEMVISIIYDYSK